LSSRPQSGADDDDSRLLLLACKAAVVDAVRPDRRADRGRRRAPSTGSPASGRRWRTCRATSRWRCRARRGDRDTLARGGTQSSPGADRLPREWRRSCAPAPHGPTNHPADRQRARLSGRPADRHGELTV